MLETAPPGPRSTMLSPRAVTLSTATAAAGATLIVLSTSRLQFAYHAPALHAALETAAGLIGLLAAFLLLGRYSLSSLLPDLVLGCGLALVATNNLLFGAIPVAIDPASPHALSTWAAALGALLGTLVFAAGAYVPSKRVARPRLAGHIAIAGCAAALAAVVGIVWLLHPALPTDAKPLSPARPAFGAHPSFQVLQLEAAMAYATAAIAFTRRARRGDDDLMLWLGVASVLFAAGRFNYFLYPSLYSEWVYTGDGFRLLGHAVLTIGAGREIGRYWRDANRAAVLEERRRIARELHDGLAQELSYIARRARALTLQADPRSATQIEAAAVRALGESRRAIATLTRPFDEPLDVALEHAIEAVAARYDVQITFELEPAVRVSPERREALIRIACEAVSNAAQHAHGEIVHVRLEGGEHPRLRVVDHGTGFDLDADRPRGGFGLTSMRERALAVGAQLDLSSAPGRGTSVEVTI
jgi:signal transduction histidine kinase